ncbi:ribonuclease H-like domain-containing protein [Tanacetum coccineum]|uniref:Ribonuclease H-like domain-containing protein n=1 Tax=Tanacetum coccineum TaxID=301880 RepID=A0ABQ5E0D7_9ASTR
MPTLSRPLYLHNVRVTPNIIKNLIYVRQFTRDNKCTIEFDEFGFSVKDFLTRHILLRCDNSGDLYPVTKPSYVPSALLSVSPATWHQRLGHPDAEVIWSLISCNFISCNEENSSHICYACQLGKHAKLLFVSSDTRVSSSFDIIHSDIWTSPIVNVGGTRPELLSMGALSSLKQAPRTWFQRFASYALRVGFSSSRCDSSLFIYRHGTKVAYLLIYVDDIVLVASSTDLLQCIISSLHKEFDMTDLGALNYFLGISITRDSIGIFLSQKKYALKLLDMAHMANCNPTRMPVDTESKLGFDRDPIFDPTLYRSLASGLQYLTFTRSLVTYTDANWAGCPTTRQSTSGYCVFLRDNLLSWSSKRQYTLSRSSAEAEYRGVANVVAEIAWLHNLLKELHTLLFSTTLVYCGNVSAIYMTVNPIEHQRTKHIEIDIHFVCDMVARGQVRVLHVPSRYQYADIFIKGLPSALFEEFRTSLSVRPSPAQTAGEC